MEPENDGLEDDLLFKWVIFRFPAGNFAGSITFRVVVF